MGCEVRWQRLRGTNARQGRCHAEGRVVVRVVVVNTHCLAVEAKGLVQRPVVLRQRAHELIEEKLARELGIKSRSRALLLVLAARMKRTVIPNTAATVLADVIVAANAVVPRAAVVAITHHRAGATAAGALFGGFDFLWRGCRRVLGLRRCLGSAA
jgi:hypothetical protein